MDSPHHDVFPMGSIIYVFQSLQGLRNSTPVEVYVQDHYQSKRKFYLFVYPLPNLFSNIPKTQFWNTRARCDSLCTKYNLSHLADCCFNLLINPFFNPLLNPLWTHNWWHYMVSFKRTARITHPFLKEFAPVGNFGVRCPVVSHLAWMVE